MKIEIEFTSEQFQRLVDSNIALHETLERKVNHLKGRVRALESRQMELVKAVEDIHTAPKR